MLLWTARKKKDQVVSIDAVARIICNIIVFKCIVY